jgi:thioredoxin reductase (NADPH)
MTAATATEPSGFEQLLADLPPGETPDLSGAFPRFEDSQLRALEAWGRRRPVASC